MIVADDEEHLGPVPPVQHDIQQHGIDEDYKPCVQRRIQILEHEGRCRDDDGVRQQEEGASLQVGKSQPQELDDDVRAPGGGPRPEHQAIREPPTTAASRGSAVTAPTDASRLVKKEVAAVQ